MPKNLLWVVMAFDDPVAVCAEMATAETIRAKRDPDQIDSFITTVQFLDEGDKASDWTYE